MNKNKYCKKCGLQLNGRTKHLCLPLKTNTKTIPTKDYEDMLKQTRNSWIKNNSRKKQKL